MGCKEGVHTIPFLGTNRRHMGEADEFGDGIGIQYNGYRRE